MGQCHVSLETRTAYFWTSLPTKWNSLPLFNRWTQELKRFASVFRLYQSTKGNNQVFYVAGNHDYGFGDGVVGGAYTRFVEYLGDPNWAVQIANHTLIAIDTLSLSGSGDTVPKHAADSFLTGVEAGELSLLVDIFPMTSGLTRYQNTQYEQNYRTGFSLLTCPSGDPMRRLAASFVDLGR